MGTVCDIPSRESKTIPVVRPEAYKEITAWKKIQKKIVKSKSKKDLYFYIFSFEKKSSNQVKTILKVEKKLDLHWNRNISSKLGENMKKRSTYFWLSFISDIGVFLTHINHDILMSGTTNDWEKDSSCSIVKPNDRLKGKKFIHERKNIIKKTFLKTFLKRKIN